MEKHALNSQALLQLKLNYCDKNKTRIAGLRRAKRVHVHPTYRAKQGKGKENMPIYDFALIEVKKRFTFSEKVKQNRGLLFRVVIW